jgi:hypothetical protein
MSDLKKHMIFYINKIKKSDRNFLNCKTSDNKEGKRRLPWTKEVK